MLPLAITWLGHSTFLMRTPGGRRLLLDPWLTANPRCPERLRRQTEVDLVLATHGHEDHIGDLVPVARETGALVVAPYELCDWVGRKGITHTAPMNKGGSLDVQDLRISMTDARHSSGCLDNGTMVYMGEACGYVLRLEDGVTIYYAGDTSLFGDMKLIGETFRPDIAVLPIGDRFTMGPQDAAIACEWLGVRQVIPMHWGTFPLLTGTPDTFRRHLRDDIQMLELRPGDTAQ